MLALDHGGLFARSGQGSGQRITALAGADDESVKCLLLNRRTRWLVCSRGAPSEFR